jgi:hypothetical protein
MSEASQNNKRGVVPEGLRCRGWSRTEDRPCKQRRVPGSEYCHYHGGKNPKGAAHPHYKHGKRSKFRPKGDVLENYDRYLKDPDLTHHREAIALVDALVQQVLDEWEDGGTPELWRRLKATWRRFEVAWRARDMQKATAAIAEVGLLLQRGADQSKRVSEIVRILEARRKHADSETKRKLSEAHTFTIEEAAAFYTSLGAAVRRRVLDPNMSDEEKLTAIENDMAAIAGAASGELPASPDAH